MAETLVRLITRFVSSCNCRYNRSWMRPVLIGGTLALLGLALLLLWGSEEAEAWQISADMGNCDDGLDVSPNGTGMCHMNETIESEEPFSQTFEVQTTCGGSISVTPQVYTVGVGAYSTSNQELVISALKGSALQQRDCMVTARRTHVSGIADPTNDEKSTGFKITILQYAMVSIDIEPDHYVIDEGDSLNLIFNLTNEGNYVDDFRLSLRGLPADWSAEYPEIIQNVPAGGIPQVNLTLQAGNDGTAKLRLVAISQFNTSVMDCARVTVKAESTDTWLQVNAALLSGGTSVALVGVAASGVVWQRRGSGEEEW